MADPETVTCPDCEGVGQHRAECRLHPTWLRCAFCDGAGRVSERVAAFYGLGERLRDHRVHQFGRKGREEAVRLGLQPITLNHQEWGRNCVVCQEPPSVCGHTAEEAEAAARAAGRLG